MRSYAREAMARIAKDEKSGKKSFTATETGARAAALKRFARGESSYANYVKNTVRGGIKGGIQEKAPSQSDIETMIKRGR